VFVVADDSTTIDGLWWHGTKPNVYYYMFYVGTSMAYRTVLSSYYRAKL